MYKYIHFFSFCFFCHFVRVFLFLFYCVPTLAFVHLKSDYARARCLLKIKITSFLQNKNYKLKPVPEPEPGKRWKKADSYSNSNCDNNTPATIAMVMTMKIGKIVRAKPFLMSTSNVKFYAKTQVLARSVQFGRFDFPVLSSSSSK